MEHVELWTASKRTKANLAAMRLAAEIARAPREVSDEERATILAYSGWGGLSIEDNEARFPEGFPKPAKVGLIHEYYTPRTVTEEIARVVSPLLRGLAGADGRVHALEPSTGIGRFIEAFRGERSIEWHAVEFSPVSAALFRAAFPGVELTEGPFERWAAQHARPVNLVIANPPYGTRDYSFTEDPDRAYQQRSDGTLTDAYAYFLRRAQDMVVAGGLGVWVIPSEFITGTSPKAKALRTAVLMRHHLAAAYRLPSGIFAGSTGSRDPDKPTTGKHVLNIDVVFLRSRGGTLEAVDPNDRFIVDGDYYVQHREHILGREVSGEAGKAERRERGSKELAYQVLGRFERLPELVERQVCGACRVVPLVPAAAPKAEKPKPKRDELAADAQHWLVRAAALGRRVRSYLALVASQDLEVPALAHGELVAALDEWVKRWGAPSSRTALVAAAESNGDVRAFLTAFARGSKELIPSIRVKPKWEPRYTGRADDVVALAEWRFKQHRRVTRADLVPLALDPLFRAGWCEDELGSLMPERAYLEGDLWARHDRAKVRADLGDQQAALQVQKLLAVIKPAVFDEIEGVSPRQGWVPLDLVAEWMGTKNFGAKAPKLVRLDGMLQVEGWDFKPAKKDGAEAAPESKQVGISPELDIMLGWINHNRERFRPRKPETNFKVGDWILVAFDADPNAPTAIGTVVSLKQFGYRVVNVANIEKDKDVVFEIAIEDSPNVTVNAGQVAAPSRDQVREAVARKWEREFREWIGADAERRAVLEHAYQRTFQGYKAPSYDGEPVPIARWTTGSRKLHAYQNAALRRMLESRGGLLAFDVGLGKTYTGLATVARARQEGWARRPVILVPNSIIWKWVADFRAVLPDYSVGVVGSKKKLITRGPRAGLMTSETDTPADRSTTWSRFQAGEYDVVLMTYSSLSRTRLKEASIVKYIEKKAAIQRQLLLRGDDKDEGEGESEGEGKKKGKKGKKKLSERNEAVVEARTGRWVGEQLQLPKGWAHDPGIEWGELGIDLLIVDEAQNYKNLYMPEPREGGVPKFMGNPGDGSRRAWQLDFRSSTVRNKTGGAGIVLLSATPAKNSPLEFYSLIQLVDANAFARMGIDDPEQFIDRYCKIETRDVIGSSGEVERKSAVVGFQNLHELRDIVFRYANFKTAQQVGLKIPEGKPERISVDLDAAQEAKFAEYLARLEEMREDPTKGNPLGIMARLNLVAIHARMDENYGWRDSPGRPPKYNQAGEMIDAGVPPTVDARKVDSPHSPKFDALAREILGQQGCGHIVFIDNVAAHVWIMMTLVDAGIPADRIAILNAEAVEDLEGRLRIGQEFNGQPATINGDPVADLSAAGPDDVITEAVPPRYDVLIANAVAYEGMDLQTRTCQVHHIDLPYEPSTLQQRNGRAVRQGNKAESLPIKYYIARRSLDGFRFNLIQGKLGWMNDLIAGTSRSTNNPGAQEVASVEDMLIELSRNPALTAELQEKRRQQRLEEARQKAAKAAAATMRIAAARFALAREVSEPVRAATLRSEGEKMLASLQTVDPAAWPWFEWGQHARDRSMLVPAGGQSPVYEGLRVGIPDPEDPSNTKFLEFGKAIGSQIGVRRAGSVTWVPQNQDYIAGLKLTPDAAGVAERGWPDETAEIEEALREAIYRFYTGPEAWTNLGWSLATDPFVERMWSAQGARILRRIEEYAYGARAWKVPGLFPDGTVAIGMRAREGVAPTAFAPTEAGFLAFQQAAVAGDKKTGAPQRSEIPDVAVFWWGRRTPRDLFTAAEAADALEAFKAAVAEYMQDGAVRAGRVLSAAADALEYNVLDEPALRLLGQVFGEVKDEAKIRQDWPAAKVRKLIVLRRQVEALTAPPPASSRAAASLRPSLAPPVSVAAASSRAASLRPMSLRPLAPAPASSRRAPMTGRGPIDLGIDESAATTANPTERRGPWIEIVHVGDPAKASPASSKPASSKPAAPPADARGLRLLAAFLRLCVQGAYRMGTPRRVAHTLGGLADRIERGEVTYSAALTALEIAQARLRNDTTARVLFGGQLLIRPVFEAFERDVRSEDEAEIRRAFLDAWYRRQQEVLAPLSVAPVSSRLPPWSTATPSSARRIEARLDELRGSEAKHRAAAIGRARKDLLDELNSELRAQVRAVREYRKNEKKDPVGLRHAEQHLATLLDARRAVQRNEALDALASSHDEDEEDAYAFLARWARQNLAGIGQLGLLDAKPKSAQDAARAELQTALRALQAKPEMADASAEVERVAKAFDVALDAGLHPADVAAAVSSRRPTTAPASSRRPASARPASSAAGWVRVQSPPGPAHTILRGSKGQKTVCGVSIWHDGKLAKGYRPAPADARDCGNCARMRESTTAHGETEASTPAPASAKRPPSQRSGGSHRYSVFDPSSSAREGLEETLADGVDFTVAQAALWVGGPGTFAVDDETGENVTEKLAPRGITQPPQTVFHEALRRLQRMTVLSDDEGRRSVRVVPIQGAGLKPRPSERHWQVVATDDAPAQPSRVWRGEPQQLAEAQVEAVNILQDAMRWAMRFPPPASEKPSARTVQRRKDAAARDAAQAELARRHAEGPPKVTPPAPGKPEGYALGERVLIRDGAPGWTGEKYAGRTGKITRISHSAFASDDWDRRLDIDLDMRPRERTQKVAMVTVRWVRPAPPASVRPVIDLGIDSTRTPPASSSTSTRAPARSVIDLGIESSRTPPAAPPARSRASVDLGIGSAPWWKAPAPSSEPGGFTAESLARAVDSAVKWALDADVKDPSVAYDVGLRQLARLAIVHEHEQLAGPTTAYEERLVAVAGKRGKAMVDAARGSYAWRKLARVDEGFSWPFVGARVRWMDRAHGNPEGYVWRVTYPAADQAVGVRFDDPKHGLENGQRYVSLGALEVWAPPAVIEDYRAHAADSNAKAAAAKATRKAKRNAAPRKPIKLGIDNSTPARRERRSAPIDLGI